MDKQEQAVYDDPNVDNINNNGATTNLRSHHSGQMNFGHTVAGTGGPNLNRRSLIGPNLQQRFEIGLPSPINTNNNNNTLGLQQQTGGRNNLRPTIQQEQHHHPLKYQPQPSVGSSSFNTVHPINLRPQSMVSNGLNPSSQQQQQQQLLRGQIPLPTPDRMGGQMTAARESSGLIDDHHHQVDCDEELDDELYNVLSESREDQLTSGRGSGGQRTLSNEPDYSNQINGETTTTTTTSDSSQRTGEMVASMGGNHHHHHQSSMSSSDHSNSRQQSLNNTNNNNINTNTHHLVMPTNQRDYVDYYN